MSARLGRALLMLFAVAIVVVAAGFARARIQRPIPTEAWNALTDAETYELYSINPDIGGEGLDAYPLLGKTAVDAETRSALGEALDRAPRASRLTALCFEPRHGIRVTRGGVATDFVICFKCHQVQVWRDGKMIAGFSTNKSAESLFDRVLTQSGI